MSKVVTMVSPKILKVHPRNQEFFDDISGVEYEMFRESIREHGILQDLVVSSDMTVLAGHQRLKAALDEEIQLVAVNIRDDIISEEDKLSILLASNFGRVKNDPIKQAKVYEEYEKLKGVRIGSAGSSDPEPNNSVGKVKQEDVAKELGVSVDTIQNLKRLLRLEPEIQELISEGRISPTTGFTLISKLSADEQKKLVAMLPDDVRLSKGEVEKYAVIIQAKEREIKDIGRRLEKQVNENFKIREEVVERARTLAEEDIKKCMLADIKYRQEYEKRKQLEVKYERLEKDNEAMRQALAKSTELSPKSLECLCDKIMQQVTAYMASPPFVAALDDGCILSVSGKLKGAVSSIKSLQDFVKRESGKQKQAI